MAGVALRVRVQSGRDGERHTAPRRLVATDTTGTGALVLPVVERDAKTAKTGEAFETGVRVAEVVDVTDGTQGYVDGGELCEVTINAGLVSGESRLCCRRVALVTVGATGRACESGVRARTRV